MNVKAFLPGSLVDIRPNKEVDYIEGKTLDFKIIKMDKVRIISYYQEKLYYKIKYQHQRKLLQTIQKVKLLEDLLKT